MLLKQSWAAGAIGAAICVGGLAMPASADVLTEWNEKLLNTVRQNGGFTTGGPGPISRYSAMMYVAAYDAVNSITRTHEPYLSFGTCPPGTSMEAAVAAAAHTTLCAIFPEPSYRDQYDALYAAQLATIRDVRARDAGIALGTSCAQAVLKARENDGSNDTVEYVYGKGPGYWVPTFPDYTGPWGDFWALVTPWCISSADQFRPATGPYGYNDMASLITSPEYAADYNEVKAYGAIYSEVRTEDQTIAAAYWANDRNGTFKPPGHLFHITERIAAVKGNTLEQNARLFALVALGMADAGIAAWDCKYETDIDLWRPITAVWEADNDGNPLTEGDPGWLGLSYDPTLLIFTPPFPAWVSGHATFGAVHAAVVRNFYGTDAITFTAGSDDTPGYERTFTSLETAARENGLSRIWLGVHFRMDAEGGYGIGTAIGDYISANFLRKLGDLDGDGAVVAADLAILLGAWGSTGVPADLDRSGIVDASDVAVLLGNWG